MYYSLWLLAPVVLWAQAADNQAPDAEANEVSAAETTASEGTGEAPAGDVVEIPDASIEGVSMNDSDPDIPTDVQALPEETEIVLEFPGQGTAEPGAATLGSEETISVDFPDEDVRTILRNIADLFELNLVIPDTLQGRTSLKLRNITWQQAFEVVLEPLGFTYVEDRNIIMIKSIDELTTEPVDTRVFVVSYARAQDIRGSIEPLIDTAAGGRVQVDARSNALVITERPSRMNKIQEIIERLDRATDQVMIESKFIEVRTTDGKDVGVNWSSLGGEEGIDVGMTEAIAPVTGAGTNFVTEEAQDALGFPTTAATSGNNLTRNALDTAVFSASSFGFVLRALETRNEVELISNPTVVTMDNEQATIKVTREFPQPDFTFNAETGQRQFNGLGDPIDVGITLEVTPSVNAAGFINLDIFPEVSSTSEDRTIEGTEFPIRDVRTARTRITIKDGYTLALGGLLDRATTKSGNSVPLLGSLPGVGRLFSSDSDSVVETNLIIFITAKTLNPDGTNYRDTADPRLLERTKVVPSDVPGIPLPVERLERLDEITELRAEQEAEEKSAKELEQIESLRKSDSRTR